MQTRTAIKGLFYRAVPPALCILLIGYFAFHAVGGPNGIVAWKGYRSERTQLAAKVSASAEAKAALEREVKLLDPHKVDPDLADELVRKNLNVVKPDEVIVPLDQK